MAESRRSRAESRAHLLGGNEAAEPGRDQAQACIHCRLEGGSGPKNSLRSKSGLVTAVAATMYTFIEMASATDSIRESTAEPPPTGQPLLPELLRQN